MTSFWKATIGSTLLLALCDAAFSQAAPATGQPPQPKHAAESMQIGGRITEERVNVRTGPGAQYERTRLVDKETRVTVTAKEGSWAQVSLPNGATGWVGLQFVDPERAIVVAKAPTAVAPAITKTSRPANSPVSRAATAQATPQSAKPAAALLASPTALPVRRSQPVPQTPKAAGVTQDAAGVLGGTKPDILSGAKETPAASAGDSFRMLIVLLPVLGGIVLAVRGLKSVQQRTGVLPDFRKGMRGAALSLVGGFNLNNARKTGGSSLRVVESIPLGTASLHLVEARGRVLLLGASGGSLSTLADLTDVGERSVPRGGDSDFQSVLNSMSDNLSEDFPDLSGSVGLTVGSLEDQIRATREAIARASARSRS